MARQMELEHIEADERMSAAMPKVEELLQILIETNQQQAAQSVAFMMEFMDSMEGQLESVNQELQAVRSELNALQDAPGAPTIKERLTNMIKGLEQTAASLQARIKEMKDNLNERAGQVVDNFKKQGIKALAGVTQTLGLKAMLSSIQTSFETRFAKMEDSIGQIYEVERKYRESVMHVKNAGRTLMGKETQKEAAYPEKGFFANMRKPYQSMKNIYALGMAEAKRAVAKVERLEQAGKQAAKGKTSIAEKLKKFKVDQEKADKEGVRNHGQTARQNGKGQEYGR